jgi:hypothetical protein
LESGLGLRREEADKAQWDWFFTSRTGRRLIEVRKTEYFTPKGKRRRIIPVEQVLWDAIHETLTDAFNAGLTEMPELRYAQVAQGTAQSVY